MKTVFKALATAALGLSLTVTAVNADTVYKAGGASHGGQKVNAYTNSGARQYRNVMRTSRSGQIYNLAPKPTLRKKVTLANLKIPSSVSYKKSHRQDLPDRVIRHGTASVNLSDIIEKHAKRYNLDPMLVEEVIRQESNFRSTATSRVGAQGLMQLMPGTASMLGVRKANDPDQNIEGGARYLAMQLTKFGRLDYALAAYNAGPGAVSSYGGIPPYAETRNYVARIVNSYNNRVKQEKRKKKN
jgi:soluble lytic murein transglycosylase-like protein